MCVGMDAHSVQHVCASICTQSDTATLLTAPLLLVCTVRVHFLLVVADS